MVVVSAALVALAGCGSASESSSGSPAGPSGVGSSAAAGSGSASGCAGTTTVGAEGASLLPVPPAAVTLEDPGAAPQAALTGTPDRTTAQQVSLRVVSSSTTARAGDQPSSSTQDVTLPLTARVACTDPTDVELDLGRPSSPDTGLAGSLAAVAGSRAGLAVTTGSVPVSLRLLPAAGADDAARAAIEQTMISALQRSVSLPTQPVGIGARWRAVRTIDGAATVTQTLTATLRARTGSRLTLDVTVDETPVSSTFTVPGQGQQLTIDSFTFAGSGTLDVDLTRGLPVSGSLSVSGGRTLVGDDPARPLVQRTSLAVTWS
ncbi:hypothetical protein LX14_003616 [Williamsia deligens]|nr:hypothetical protein [Williamsia deligens]